MTHTPGPWTAFYKPKYDEWHVSLPSGSGMKMALCPDGIQSGNREDDAQLIAAAPDMLAALKVAKETLRSFDAGDPSTESGWASDELLDAWKLCDAAIAKAESSTTTIGER